MSNTFTHFIPWATDKNLSGYYNDKIMSLPNDYDWALFTDRDTYFPHPFYGKHIEAVLRNHGDKYKLFTAMTNRVGTSYQCVHGMWTADKGLDHEDRAKSLWLAQGTNVEDITDKSPISGMLILVQKRLLSDGELLKDGLLLGADNLFHYIAQEYGFKVGLMKGIYIYHYYRNGIRENKKHLL